MNNTKMMMAMLAAGTIMTVQSAHAISTTPPATAAPAPTFFGETDGGRPYTSLASSPFAPAPSEAEGETDNYFWLEDFEDGLLNTVGLSADAGIVRGPTSVTDSVDGDDGVIDGFGVDGSALLVSGTGPQSVTFTFDSQALVNAPTFAGVVWTDGPYQGANVTFEAFDLDGNSIGSFTDWFERELEENGTTDADRLLGVAFDGGIGSITVSSDYGALELDHVQYGYTAAVVPLPAPVVMGLAGLGVVGVIRRRRKA